MPDDKSKRASADRRRVAGKETYEASYFARKSGIPVAQVRELIDKIGNSREKLIAAANRLTNKKR